MSPLDSGARSGVLPRPLAAVRRVRWAPAADPGSRVVPEESPVALVYDGATEAVMMASPADLEDFAVGFSLTEGLITDPAEICEIDVVAQRDGIEARLWLADPARDRVRRRRRRLAGPVGCGLCGIASLAEAVKPCRTVSGALRLDTSEIARAVDALTGAQALNALSRAMHAAGLYRPAGGLVMAREDVGRHNALDKLAGAIARARLDTGEAAVVITSRVSVEMVQKTAAIGAPVLIAASAPTALAIRAAHDARLTLVALARPDGFEVFAHAHRIVGAR